MTTEKLPIRLSTLDNRTEEMAQALTLGVYDQYRGKVTKVISDYLNKSVRLLHHIKSCKCAKEFHDACKSRAEEFIKIIAKIIHEYNQDDDSSLRVESTNNGAFTQLKINGDVIFHYKEFYPASHRVLINGLEVLNNIHEPAQIRIVLRAFCSACHWYKDMRWNDRTQKNLNFEEACFRIFDSEPIAETPYMKSEYRRYENSVDFYDKSTFVKYTTPVRRLLMDMYFAMAKLPKNFEQIEFPYYVSLKSSGLYDKKKKRTVPALFAAQYEKDQLDGYGFPNIDLTRIYSTTDDVEDRFVGKDIGKTVSIEQKKLDERVIHISPNFVQDRLIPYHLIAARVLKNNKHDCTFDQKKGFLRSKLWTGRNFEENAVLSLDLSKATDTWDIMHQANTLKRVLTGHVSDVKKLTLDWIALMRYPTLANNERRVMKYGQPQGRLSSFPVFALSHHIVMLTTLCQMDEEGIFSEHDLIDYVVLGDDSCITLPKRAAQVFIDKYIQNMNTVNVVCNPDKGYKSIDDGPRLSEFAKVLSMDGHFMTPTPWNLLSQSTKNWMNRFKLAIWYANYSNDIELNVIADDLCKDTSYSPNTVMAVLAILCDIETDSNNFESEYYTKRQKSKVNYFFDWWYLRDSIIMSILESSSVDAVHKNYTTETFEKEFLKQLGRYKEYYNEGNKKLEDLFDEHVAKQLVKNCFESDIDLSTEESRIIVQLFSSLRTKEFDPELTLSKAVDILTDFDMLAAPEDYERDPEFTKITNALRQRSFISEFNAIRDDKIRYLIQYLSDETEDPVSESTDEMMDDFFSHFQFE